MKRADRDLPCPKGRTRRCRAGRRRPALALLAAAAALLVAGCRTSAVAPERGSAWARAELLPTYTALPAPTATLTALPSSTPTARYATPTPDVFQRAGLPVRIEIPAIGVDAVVEKVGRDAEGKVDVPKFSENVAWFDESALPGQGGKTSVVSGHLDDPFGPAVFYELRRLVPGDELAITYSSGERFVFVVDDKERYSTDAVPSQRIFGTTPKQMLNLITCDGAWDSSGANYQQRLVVYTRLKDGATDGASSADEG